MLRMEAPFTLTVPCDCSLTFGATLPPERRKLPALTLFSIVVSLATIRPAAVAKESSDMCEEIQVFRGIQDTEALPGKLFFYPISPFAFHGTITHYKVTLANGSVLPKWLEYNPNTSTLQGLPMLEESGEYHLTVAAHGKSCDPNTPAATASFALHVHSYVTVCEKQTSTNQKPVNDNIGPEGLCAKDIPVTFAEIIIYHPAGSLSIQERLYLIYTMAEYLHLDPSFLTLIPYKESFNKHLWNLTVLSEDTKYISSTVKNHYVGLCWPVGFGVFAMLYELVQVLRHNVQSSHLSQLLGNEIAGWRILQKGGNKKKHVRKQHRKQLMATPRPTLRPTKIGVKPTKIEAFTLWSTTLFHTKFAVRPSANSSSLNKDSRTAVPSYTDISLGFVTSQRDLETLRILCVHTRPPAPAFTVFQSLSFAVPELSPFLMTASLTDFGRQEDLCSRTPSISELPQSPVQQQTKIEAFTLWSTTLFHTKFAVRPSASSSSLYKDSRTAVPSYTDISLGFVTSQRDLETLRILSVHTRPPPPAFTVFQSLSFAVPELLPSLMTASLTDFGRQEDLSSRTPPISELPQSPVQQQDMHFTPKKSEPKPHFTQYLSFSVTASKIQTSRPVQHTMNVSVSQEDTPYEKMPVAHFPQKTITNLAHSSPYAYLTTSGLASEDILFTANLPVLSTMSTLVELRFPFSTVAPSLFTGHSHQNQDLFSNDRYASESFMSSPQMQEHLFMEEKSSSLPAFQAETSKWVMDLNLMDVTSTCDSATQGNTSVHEFQLAADTSPVPQLYYSKKSPNFTTFSTQESITSLFISSVEFGLQSRTDSIPIELSSLPLSTSEELIDSIKFHNISPVEELWSTSRYVSRKVFKTDEHTSELFVTVSQTNRLLFMKDKTSTLTKIYVETPVWNEPCHLINITTSGGGVLGSQFLGVDSLRLGASQTYLWYSYYTELLSLPGKFAGTPMFQFSTDYFSSYTSGVVRIPVTCPGVLQLETSDLNLDSPLGTKAVFPITMQLTPQLLEDSTVTSLQAELHATAVFPGGQGQPNTSPRVVNAINWITATIGHKFSFSVPPDTFYDQEDGDTSQLTLGMNPADGSPIGAGNWLHFNSHIQTMHGYPLANDFQYSPQEFLLFATDSEGLKTSDMLTIELLRPSTIPCHNYTIRTKNSFHSFLRERERVYLFFEKLSKYLRSSSPGSMTLLHLRPGSTLITWYDSSFCTKNNRCARDEIQGVLVKLRLPSGNVNPDFVEAMLPEYNIYHIEDVVYGGTCSSNKSLISNQTITAFKDCHSWTRIFHFALVIIMCAAVIILMMTFWYCKYKRITGSQSMSFHGKSFVSSADTEMDVLKSQKSAILEQEVPWPAELWWPMPKLSQQHPSRPSTNPAASRLPPPPKYRLPPLYGITDRKVLTGY